MGRNSVGALSSSTSDYTIRTAASRPGNTVDPVAWTTPLRIFRFGRSPSEPAPESFESPDEWQQWYEHGASDLVWSDKKHEFITEPKEK
jgi:hypothetical protein